MHQGLDALVARESLVARPLCLVWLAEATGQAGQVDAGLRLLAEALEACATSGEGMGWRRQSAQGRAALLLSVRAARRMPQAAEAEACFQQALAIARRQQAKSWELRAAMSLSRLWQQQGKRADAHAYWHRSTAGSPRALTPPTCRRPRRCWRHWRDPICRVPRLGMARHQYGTRSREDLILRASAG